MIPTHKYYWKIWVQIQRRYEIVNRFISGGDVLPHLEVKVERKLAAILDLLKDVEKECQK